MNIRLPSLACLFLLSATAFAQTRPTNEWVLDAWLGEIETWNKAHLLLIRPEAVKSAEGVSVPNALRLVVEKNYTLPPAAKEYVVPTWFLDDWTETGRWNPRPMLSTSRALVVMPVDLAGHWSGDGPWAKCAGFDLEKLTDRQAKRLKSLELISSYRRAHNEDEKARAAAAILSGEGDVGLMYLCSEWASQDRVLNTEERGRILAARENRQFGAVARLRASSLLNRADKEYKEKGEHWRWVRDWIAAPEHLDRWSWQQLLQDFGRYTPTDDPKLFEKEVWPMLAQVLLDPKTDDVKTTALLRDYVQRVGTSTNISRDTRLAVLSFLVDQSGTQPTREQRAQYRDVARSILTLVMLRRDPQELADFRAALPRLREKLSDQLGRTKSAAEQTQIKSFISETSRLEARGRPLSGPATAPVPSR